MDIHTKVKEMVGLTDREIIDSLQKMTLNQYVALYSALENNDVDTVTQLFLNGDEQ